MMKILAATKAEVKTKAEAISLKLLYEKLQRTITL